MELFTRCSNCATTFRVTTPQLQASGGRVRCGHCQNIFDAFATLTAQEPQPAALPAPAVEEGRKGDKEPAAIGASAQPAFPETPVFQKDIPPAARPDPAESLYEWEFRMPETPRRTALWSVFVFALSVVLVAQAAFAFRAEVMVSLPQTRSYYVRLCDSLGCAIGLPKLSNYLHIETSDLKAVDASHPNEIQLLLSVRNRAPIDLAYPAFELTLTDAMEQAVARRVFLPAEYLAPAAQQGGMKAGTEMPIQLYLDTGAQRAAGLPALSVLSVAAAPETRQFARALSYRCGLTRPYEVLRSTACRFQLTGNIPILISGRVPTKTGSVVVGITHHAQESLGDLVFVESPALGRRLKMGRTVRRGGNR